MKYLYLPIEIALRELDARLLTALFAVQHGMEVLIGQKWLLQRNIDALPQGAFLFKTLTPGDYKHMKNAARHGHGVYAIDEEMPGLGEGCGDLKWVLESAVEACDAIFLPGAAHFEAMRKRFPASRNKIFATGNPRWDLLRPELRGLYARDADALRRRHGRFVLVNTNVGLMNSAKSSPEKLLRNLTADGRLDFSLEKDRKWAEALKVFQIDSLDATISFTRKLTAAVPDRKIVVRPHPTENLSTYTDAFRDNPRVVVVTEGPAAPWIMASDVLVHTACTTANEAFALGVPSVCIKTGQSIFYDYFISHKVSLEAQGVDDAVRLVQLVLRDPSAAAAQRTPAMKATFDRFFAAGEGKFAAERMVEIISGGMTATRTASASPNPQDFRTWRLRTRFQKVIFPDAPAEKLEKRIVEMAKQLNMTALPRVDKCAQAVYRIRGRDNPDSGLRLPPYRSWLGDLF